MTEMRRLMTQLKLTINEAKTDTRQLPQERFDFLGYSFGRYYSSKTGQAYLCARPSKKSVKRVGRAAPERDSEPHALGGWSRCSK
jgi:RNA-directed DNA polymerase